MVWFGVIKHSTLLQKQALKDTGMWEDTVFLFTSDNGGNPIVGGACVCPHSVHTLTCPPDDDDDKPHPSIHNTHSHTCAHHFSFSNQPDQNTHTHTPRHLNNCCCCHHHAGFNYMYRGAKSTAWEGGVRVPGFIRAPKVRAACLPVSVLIER